MNVLTEDSTGGVIPYCNTDYKPYLVDGFIVWIHDRFFDQTRVATKPFQKVVKIHGNDVWLELV